MAHEYVHFVQGNVASSRGMPSAAIAAGFAVLISSYAAASSGDRIMDTYAGEGYGRQTLSDELGVQGGRWVRPLHVIAASALSEGQMPSIRGILTMQYGQDPGWSSPLGSFLLYRLPASLFGFIDETLGRETLVELFTTAPDVPTVRIGGQADPSAVCSWFEQCTGVPLDQLEADWHTFLASVEIDERHIGAIRLLRATEEIGVDSLLSRLRTTGHKLDPEFAEAFDELLDDIQRYGRRFGVPDWRNEMLGSSHEESTFGSLRERIARMAEWADELEKAAASPRQTRVACHHGGEPDCAECTKSTGGTECTNCPDRGNRADCTNCV